MRRSAEAGRQMARRWTEDEGRAMVAAWRRSGASLAAFARQRGVQDMRLRYWVARLAELKENGTPRVRFHPIRLIEASEGPRRRDEERIEVVLADGRSVRVPTGFAAEDLERVLQVLEPGH